MPSSLLPVTLRSPAFNGLNSQAAFVVGVPSFASIADNCVFDQFGRISARKGFRKLTTTALTGSPNVEQIHEYWKNTTTQEIISAADNKLFTGTTTLTNITGAVVATANNWKFQNFNTKCVAWQKGHTPIVYTGAGNWGAIAVNSGTQPNGDTCLAAFGRVWAIDDDATVVRYSALLDETRWASADGGGVIDLKTVWSRGMDRAVALAAHMDHLVILCRHSIVAYANPSTPFNLTLSDIVEGTGCIARDTVQSVGTDLMFLSKEGVRSFSRTLETENFPLQELTKYVRSDIEVLTGVNPEKSRSVYSKTEGFYLVKTGEFYWCLDLRGLFSDPEGTGTLPRITKWSGLPATALAFAVSDNKIYLGGKGIVGEYASFLDDAATYTMQYRSQWMDGGEELEAVLKIPKKVRLYINGGQSYTIDLLLAYDFKSAPLAFQSVVTATGTVSEYNIAEYNIGEYSGDDNASGTLSYLPTGSGQYVQVGAQTVVNQRSIALNEMSIYMKTGRLVR